MHLCTFEHAGLSQVGLVRGNDLITLADKLVGGDGLDAPLRLSAHQPMIDLITHWAAWRPQVAALLADAQADFTLDEVHLLACLLYTSPSPRDVEESRMPSSA